MSVKNPFKILVVDDEIHQRTILSEYLSKEGYSVISAKDGTEALSLLRSEENADVQLVITDLSMPDIDGIELIKRAKDLKSSQGNTLDFLMITAHGTIETAIKAMKVGAFDFLLKPIELEEMKLRLGQLFNLKKLEKKAQVLAEENQRLLGPVSVVAQSSAMKKIIHEIERVAKTDATVLLTGETGVGKEVLARFVHEKSRRLQGPFVAVNCSAIPDNLLESEFFGHEKGAFTGADRKTTGFFERADGGTLFLDEIGEMDIRLQPKILRALEDRRVRRVGGNQDISVDMRLVAATNRDLKKQVTDGKFREDLFFRLNVVHIEIPPLRKRKEDIPLLIENLISKHSKNLNVAIKKVESSYIESLQEYRFPGNVRELSNIIERSMIHAQSDVLSADTLPRDLSGHSGGSERSINTEAIPIDRPLNDSLIAYEQRIIEAALERHGGDVDLAAKALSVSRSTLYSKISKNKKT